MDMLLQPAPFPEEVDLGFLGRIKRINCYGNILVLWEAIAEHIGTGSGATKHELLSHMAGQTSESFARNHTSIPLRRAITVNHPHIPHGSLDMTTLLYGRTSHRDDFKAFFCEECIKEDVSFHGVSYWRRDHQIPGQLWCSKHALPLCFAESRDSFGASPEEFLGQTQSNCAKVVSEACGNLFVQRFLELANAMYERPAPLDARAVMPLLRNRAEKLGLVKMQRVRCKHPMVVRVQSTFPERWLSAVQGGKLESSGGPFQAAFSVTSYLLLIAVLFENADEAINALATAAVQETHEPTGLSTHVGPRMSRACSPP